MITPLKKCHEILEKAPPPLQDSFISRFSNLEHWEQMMLLSSLARIVDMMSAGDKGALPIMAQDSRGLS
jgi:hypothetical protein